MTAKMTIEVEFEMLKTQLVDQQTQLEGIDSQLARLADEALSQASAADFKTGLAKRRSLQVERLTVSDAIAAIQARLKRLENDVNEARKTARLREIEKSIAQVQPIFLKALEAFGKNRESFFEALKSVATLAAQLNELHAEKSTLSQDRQQRLFCDVPGFIELPTVVPSDGYWRQYAIGADEVTL